MICSFIDLICCSSWSFANFVLVEWQLWLSLFIMLDFRNLRATTNAQSIAHQATRRMFIVFQMSRLLFKIYSLLVGWLDIRWFHYFSPDVDYQNFSRFRRISKNCKHDHCPKGDENQSISQNKCKTRTKTPSFSLFNFFLKKKLFVLFLTITIFFKMLNNCCFCINLR